MNALVDVRCPRCGAHAKVPETAEAVCNSPRHRDVLVMVRATPLVVKQKRRRKVAGTALALVIGGLFVGLSWNDPTAPPNQTVVQP